MSIKKHYTQSREFNSFQEDVVQKVKSLEKCPYLNGVLLEDIELSTTPKKVEHKLGKKFTGFSVWRRSANAVVFEGTQTNPELFINLEASATVTVTLWVF